MLPLRQWATADAAPLAPRISQPNGTTGLVIEASSPRQVITALFSRRTMPYAKCFHVGDHRAVPEPRRARVLSASGYSAETLMTKCTRRSHGIGITEQPQRQVEIVTRPMRKRSPANGSCRRWKAKSYTSSPPQVRTKWTEPKWTVGSAYADDQTDQPRLLAQWRY